MSAMSVRALSLMLSLLAVTIGTPLRASAQEPCGDVDPVIEGPKYVCLNAPINYRTEEVTGADYLWSTSGGGAVVSGNGTRQVVVQWNTPGTWQLQLRVEIPSRNCFAETSLSVVVSRDLSPVIAVLGSTTLCEGDSVLLDAGQGYDSYMWNTGEDTRFLRVKSAGTYRATVGVGECIPRSTPPVDISVVPAPTPTITVAGGTLSTEPADTYQWYLDGEPIDGAVSQSVQMDQPGSYSVTVTNATGCEGSSEPYVKEAITYISLTSEQAEPGERVRMPLLLLDTGPESRIGALQFQAELSFDRSLLLPVEATNATFSGSVVDGEYRLSLQGERSDSESDTLAVITFIAALGLENHTPVRLDTFAWLDRPATVFTEDGEVTLEGICEEGAPRFIRLDDDTALRLKGANPVADQAVLQVKAVEDGPTRLLLLDALGRRVALLLNRSIAAGSYDINLDASDLEPGLYFCVLETPTQVRTLRVNVVR